MNKLVEVPDSVLKEQFASSNPDVSAWVAANAGSGKTHVLTQRVIRLMLAGNAPDQILCLTFTKAAAANMKTRVFSTLAKWTMMPDQELDAAIRKLSGHGVPAKTRNRARRLFAQALDTPGGLKIQTIHSFCEALLHQFPLEANVPGHFETLQEVGQAALLSEAQSYILAGAGTTPEISERFRSLSYAVPQEAIENGIDAIVSNRNAFMDWIEPGIHEAVKPLYAELKVDPESTPESIKEHCISNLPVSHDLLRMITETAARSDKKTDLSFADVFSDFFTARDPAEKFSLLALVSLTKAGALRSEKRGSITAFVKNEIPEAAAAIQACGEWIIEAKEKINALFLLKNSEHLFCIAEAVLQRYASLKRSAGMIDFDDQVEKCASLLNRADIRDWIRYRLDRGINHVLVDEAQDTSPKQWEIINAITADFHSGVSAVSHQRTVFVVGDEKQSIYSFQGAEPAEFASQQRKLERTVRSASKGFHPGKLSLSFRSTRDVLHAVDLVFESESNRRGLMQTGEKPVHDAVRTNDPGEVQVWPVYAKERADDVESWLDPIDKTSQTDPAIQLANRIAGEIARLVGKPLPGSKDVLKYEDILVLVRKRDRFISALTRTMKDRGLSVAGADRLILTDHIAVEDLLAIGQFVLLPQDDLNLACVLKGALFDISENALFDFAHDRGEVSLYASISSAAVSPDHPQHTLANEIVSKLEHLIDGSRRYDVFEFFAWVLGPVGMRRAFLARLGLEAEDVLDSFLDETLAYTGEGGLCLESFIATLKRAQPIIKREVELDRDEVRILTVHASKGLEAKVVFLVDACNAPWTEQHRPALLPLATGSIWLPSSRFHIAKTRESVDAIKHAAEEEYRRLLYVGMTRAADRLIVCGFRGTTEPSYQHWHKIVYEALEDTSHKEMDEEGNLSALLWHENSDNIRPGLPDEAATHVHKTPPDLPPAWLSEAVEQETKVPSVLTPTGAFALIDKSETKDATLNRSASNTAFGLQKGRMIHFLLEHLPDIPSDQHLRVSENYLQKYARGWNESQRHEVLKIIRQILQDQSFAQLFSSHSSSEVSLTGKLDTASGERLIAGQIDRLIVEDSSVTIVDYKTNQSVPSRIPARYIAQMALYRELVRQIYPDRKTICKILWVYEPALVVVEDQAMDAALEEIKNI